MAAKIGATATGADFDQTSREFDLPDGITAGQRLMAFLTMDDTPGDGSLTIADDGWTLLADNAAMGHFGGVVKMRTTIAEKIADGTESTITVECENAESVAYVGIRITDFDAATPPAIAGPVSFGQFGTPLLNPSGWDVEDTLWIAVIALDPGLAFATLGPPGYENFTEAHYTDNDGVAIAIASHANAVAQEPSVDFTASGSPDAGFFMVAIRPGTDGQPPLEFSARLSGGAGNADPALSIGGAESSHEADAELFDDVAFASAVAGLVDYRLVYVHNDEPTKSATFTAYVSQQLEVGREIAIGAAVEPAGDAVAAITNDTTAPAGVTFAAPDSADDGVALGAIGPGEMKGMWLRRSVAEDTAPDDTNAWEVSVEAVE